MNDAKMRPDWKELVDLLSRIRFSHECADRALGDKWDVFVRPWIRSSNDSFDFMISVGSRALDAPPSVQIPDFAAEAIDDPRLAEGVAGQISTYIHRELIERWAPEERRNARGEIWLRDLPMGWYSLHLDGMVTKDALSDGLLSASVLRLAAADSRPPEVAYHLADRRLVVYLRAEKDGSMLFFATETPDLKGTRIRFRVAEQSGEVSLSRPQGRGWCATAILELRPFVAQDCVPEFEIVQTTPSLANGA